MTLALELVTSFCRLAYGIQSPSTTNLVHINDRSVRNLFLEFLKFVHCGMKSHPIVAARVGKSPTRLME